MKTQYHYGAINKTYMITKILFLLYFICLNIKSHAQMNDGLYSFANDEIKLSFVVEEWGWKISSATITVLKTNQKFNGKGEWFKVNPNGIDEDYDGPMGWYQGQTDICNFEFDEPKNNTLILSSFDCVNGMKEEAFTLHQIFEENEKIEKNFDESFDYYQITYEISNLFNSWLKQGEFERSNDYSKRLEKYELQYYEICDSIIKKKLAEEVPWVSGESWYKDNSGVESFVLYEYNPNEEFFPFYFRYKKLEFRDSIYIPFSDAKTFKERTGYGSISYSNKRKNYVFYEGNIYPTIILFKNVNDKKPIEVSLNFPSGFEKIRISTSQLSLTNYNNQNLTYDFESFKIIKSELLMNYAMKHEEKQEFEDAIQAYQNILKIDGNSIKIVGKIDSLKSVMKEIKLKFLMNQADSLFANGNLEESLTCYSKAKELSNASDIENQIKLITQKINENKSTALIEKADKLFVCGKISESLILYKDANSINFSKELEERIKTIEVNIQECIFKHQLLETNYNAIQKSNSFSSNQSIFNSLQKIKEDYGFKYKSCLDLLNSSLAQKKQSIDSLYVILKKNINNEIWTEKDEDLSQRIVEFQLEFDENKKFEIFIQKACEIDDRKYLKVFKEEDLHLIITNIILSNYLNK